MRRANPNRQFPNQAAADKRGPPLAVYRLGFGRKGLVVLCHPRGPMSKSFAGTGLLFGIDLGMSVVLLRGVLRTSGVFKN